ncbi:MAG: OsmC family protein [Anaerolineales bacterium]|nr:OsmC family protein [Anaerolineales bacterium]
MEMEITFPGGARVDAHFGSFTINTDQSAQGGGEGSAPSPFATFLASLGTCAGIYVLSFLKQRGLPTEGVRIIQKTHSNPATGMIGQIDLEIQIPEDFPEKYKDALIRSAELCAVKKHFDDPPRFNIYTESVALAIN